MVMNSELGRWYSSCCCRRALPVGWAAVLITVEDLNCGIRFKWVAPVNKEAQLIRWRSYIDKVVSQLGINPFLRFAIRES